MNVKSYEKYSLAIGLKEIGYTSLFTGRSKYIFNKFLFI